MQRTSHSYYVVMEDHGKSGLEAVVQPEITRREVISRIKSGEYKNIAFIHFVDGSFEDLTDELKAEALKQKFIEVGISLFENEIAAELQAASFDHARDYRKHGSV